MVAADLELVQGNTDSFGALTCRKLLINPQWVEF